MLPLILLPVLTSVNSVHDRVIKSREIKNDGRQALATDVT